MKIYIKPECHAQIMHYVNKSKIEISGLGKVQRASDGSMVVTSIYLLKQENGPATTDIDPEAMAQLLYETRNDPGDLNFWWHSHVEMPVFWSSTDMATIQEFGRKGYLLATVFNKKNEHRSAYLQGSTGFLPEIFIDQLPTHFSYLPMAAEVEMWTKNYETLCSEKKWEPMGGNNILGKNGSEYAKWRDGGFKDADLPSYMRNHEYYTDNAGTQSGNTSKSSAKGLADLSHRDAQGGQRPSKKALDRMHLIVGNKSQMTGDDITQEIKDIFYSQTAQVQDLNDDQIKMFEDIHEILYGTVTDDIREVLYFYDQITESFASMMMLLRDIWSEIERYEEIVEVPEHDKLLELQTL